jgi:hypothetical protein
MRNAMSFSGLSGGSERELAMDVRIRPGLAVGTSRITGLSAGTERLVDDGLDSARAAAAFGAATEAAVNLLGIARKAFGSIDGVTDIVVAKDVAGTNNHETGKTLQWCGDIDI